MNDGGGDVMEDLMTNSNRSTTHVIDSQPRKRIKSTNITVISPDMCIGWLSLA
jgi:hypothetical protein